MLPHAYRRCLALCFCALFVATLPLGCDTTLAPFAEEGAYSVYGYLSLSRTRQFVRVKPLNRPVLDEATRRLDATVTLENRATGETETLEDSAVVFEEGEARTVTHNFWTEMPIAPKTQYRLTVEGADGRLTRATTTTPTATDAVISPEEGHCLNSFTVIFREVEQLPLFATINYVYNDTLHTARVLEENRPTPDRDPAYQFTPEEILASAIPLPPQPPGPFTYAPRCLELDDDKIRFRYVYVSTDWIGELPKFDDEFDPFINQPDIENGAGFFGALRRDALTITVDTSSIIRDGEIAITH